MNQIESWDTPVYTNGDLSSMSKSMTLPISFSILAANYLNLATSVSISALSIGKAAACKSLGTNSL